MSSEIGSIIVGWLLIIGTVGSYLPQYFRLAQRKSIRGLNHLTIFCGVSAGLCNSVGAIEMINLDCQTSLDCWYTFSPIIQIITPWVMLLALYFQFIHYATRTPVEIDVALLSNNSNDGNFTLEGRDAEAHNSSTMFTIIPCWVSLLCQLISISAVTFSAVLVSQLTVHRQLYGVILNISGGIMSCLMWIPQIYTSIREHGAQSLSMWTIGLHSIGCFLAVVYQATMTEQPLWNIITFSVSGTLELIIWGICLGWMIRQKQGRRYHRI